MMIVKTFLTCCGLIIKFFLIASIVSAQEYADYGNDYAQDSIYFDYANKQVQPTFSGGGIFKFLGAFGVGYLFNSKIICPKKIKKLKKKQINEQRDLYSQYYEDVYKLQKHTKELYDYVGKLEDGLKDVELEAVQRDYEEFKMPDLDGDDRISRAEFNDYVKNYLANYPGLTDKDYPKFEDFDHDKDGYISFQEYAQQMALQVQQMKSK